MCFNNFKAYVTYSIPSALKVNQLLHMKCSESFAEGTKNYINANRTTYIPHNCHLFRMHTDSSGTSVCQLTELPYYKP